MTPEQKTLVKDSWKRSYPSGKRLLNFSMAACLALFEVNPISRAT